MLSNWSTRNHCKESLWESGVVSGSMHHGNGLQPGVTAEWCLYLHRIPEILSLQLLPKFALPTHYCSFYTTHHSKVPRIFYWRLARVILRDTCVPNTTNNGYRRSNFSSSTAKNYQAYCRARTEAIAQLMQLQKKQEQTVFSSEIQRFLVFGFVSSFFYWVYFLSTQSVR